VPCSIFMAGGWTMFSIDTHDRLNARVRTAIRCDRRGPRLQSLAGSQVPRALNEVVAAIEWLRRQGAAQGIDPMRLAIGGIPPAPILRLQPH